MSILNSWIVIVLLILNDSGFLFDFQYLGIPYFEAPHLGLFDFYGVKARLVSTCDTWEWGEYNTFCWKLSADV